MGYLDKVLIDGEALEYKATLSPWAFLPDFFITAVVLLFTGGMLLAGQGNMAAFLMLVALFFAVRLAVIYFCTELAITNRRIIVKVGFISRYTNEINLDRVESIQVGQSILGRMLNYGTIVVNGTGSGHAPIRGISDPIAFRKKYNEIQAKV